MEAENLITTSSSSVGEVLPEKQIQDLPLVSTSRLGAIQTHLDVDAFVGQLPLDDLVEFVVVVPEHVDDDRVLGAAQKRDQQAVDVVPGGEEAALIVRVAVQETASGLEADQVVPGEGRVGHRVTVLTTRAYETLPDADALVT